MLKFDISATRNCKRATAVCGLRFAVCGLPEGGKETTGETALRLPSVAFPWSLAVHHQSLAFRACLYDEKNEAPEEEAVLGAYTEQMD